MPFGYYTPPSLTGAGGSKPKPLADTAPAAKPPARDRTPVERPIGDYDPRRAKRQMSRPIFGGRR